MINWKVRIKNKAFWVAIIPTVLLLAQQMAQICGVEIDVSGIGEQLVGIAGTVFSILALIGVVVDPTTEGIGDSKQAMMYSEPKGDD